MRPEVLGLPSNTGGLEGNLERANALMMEALPAGDEEQVARIVFDLYLARVCLVDICDKVLARSFHEIGRRWEHGQLHVYEERRAGEMCLRTLHRLRAILPPPPATAPVAIGATLESDPYVLPTAMVDVVLREEGWRAESLGIGHPVATACAAIERIAPRIFWLSVSAIPDVEQFLSGYAQICAAASAKGVSIVVGGRALTEAIRAKMSFAAHCDNLAHLISFVRSLKPAA